MSLIGNISIKLKLHREEVGFYKGKHSLSCNCQLLPTLTDRIKWIYAKETKRRKEKRGVRGWGVEGGKKGVIRFVHNSVF